MYNRRSTKRSRNLGKPKTLKRTRAGNKVFPVIETPIQSLHCMAAWIDRYLISM